MFFIVKNVLCSNENSTLYMLKIYYLSCPNTPTQYCFINTDTVTVLSLPDCGVATSDSILTPEQALLAKLEEENRRIEADAKCPSLTTVHSRKSSDTSQISLASGKVDKKMLTFSNAKPRQVFPTMRCIFLLKHAKSC